MHLLLDSPRFSIQFGDTHVIAHRSGRFRVADFEQAIVLLTGLLDLLPSYVAKHQRPRAAAT
jgi:hypothetical protein